LVRTQRQLNLALEGICGRNWRAHVAACRCRASRCWIRF
jgi:hypothetical protein